MTDHAIGRTRGSVKPREAAITATFGHQIAGVQIDCRDIDLAVREGEALLADARGATASNLVYTLLIEGGPRELVGGLLAVLVAQKLGQPGLDELHAGRDVRFIFGPEEGRLRAFTGGPQAVH